MTGATATGPGPPPPSHRERRDGHSSTEEEYRALWAMSRSERVAAMWREELSLRQLCQWSSRAQHEVPILAGEFAWIVMRTPDWAEPSNKLGAVPVPADCHEVDP
jgi:hypothetical protein